MSKLRIQVKIQSKKYWFFCDLNSNKTIKDLSKRIKERFELENFFLTIHGYEDTILPEEETIEIINQHDLIIVNLVLGESDPNPRFITGSNSTGSGNVLPEPEMRSEQQSEATGSEDQIINQGPLPLAPPMHTGSGNVVPEVAERSETVGSASFSVPPPPSTSFGKFFPFFPRIMKVTKDV